MQLRSLRRLGDIPGCSCRGNFPRIERAGRWAREESRREQLGWLKERWFRIALLTLGFAAFCVGLLAFKRNVITGLTVGVIMTSWGWALALLVLQDTGTASKLMGAAAEVWTAEQLHAMRPRGWRVFDAIPIDAQNHDLDHLAISPAGVFAFETKGSSSDWFSSRQSRYLQVCVSQARERAARFTRMRTAFWLRNKPIAPVLVVWGGAVDKLGPEERVRQLGDVTVVAGPWLGEWAAGREGIDLEPAEIDRAAEKVEGFLADREAHVRGPDPGRYVRAGLDGVLADLWKGVAGGFTGFFAVTGVSAWLSDLLPDRLWFGYFVIAAAFTIVSWACWLRFRPNPALVGWAVGAAASIPLMASWLIAALLAS